MNTDTVRTTKAELDGLVTESLGMDGFHRQRHWAVPMMWWEMTFGAVGAGAYISGVLSGSLATALFGFVVLAVGKGLLLLLDLGRPERVWRVFARPGTSWIARGSWVFAIFCVAGAIAIGLDLIAYDASAVARVIKTLSVMAGGVLLVYDGFFLMASKGVQGWHSGALAPYFGAGGVLTGAAAAAALGQSPESTVFALGVGGGAVGLCCGYAYLADLRNGAKGAALSARLLTSELKGCFLGIGLMVGIALPMAFFVSAAAAVEIPQWIWALVSVAGAEGVYATRKSVLEAGVYSEIL